MNVFLIICAAVNVFIAIYDLKTYSIFMTIVLN